MSQPSIDEQMRRIASSTAEVFPMDEMRRKVEKSIATKRPLRVKLGVDPTAPDITLGNAVPLWKLRTFQDLGHVAVLIIGDYTAQVGDPSGRNSLRPMLTAEQVDAYAQTYLDQVGKILLPERLEIRRNSEWLAPMNFMDVLKLLGRMTVSQMLERDDFSRRFDDETPILLHEFLYPLMQGWDSVIVQADVELGGTDQRFNLLVGRDLQRAQDQEPQVLVINPLVAGTDGAKKMSKSAGNYVGITEPANEMFGKSMSIPDALMKDWLTFFTDVDAMRVDVLCDPVKTHPRQAKEEMAKAIVRRYYDAGAAESAAAHFRVAADSRRRFKAGERLGEALPESEFVRRSTEGLPSDMPVVEVAIPADGILLVDLVIECGLAKSKSDARRLIEAGAIGIDGQTDLTPPDTEARFVRVTVKDGATIRRGRHFAFIRPV